MTVSNTFGIKVDLSWFSIVSSIFSVVSILFGSRWIVRPIKEQTNKYVAQLAFLPLFMYRMIAWLIIVSTLHRLG